MLQVTQHLSIAGAPSATTTHVLHRDYETRSRAILKTIGAARYDADPTTEVLCCCYAVDDDPVQLWRPGDPIPSEFVLAAQNSNWIVAAFNDAFETAIEKLILAPHYGWPAVPIERHRCTQAACLALGLPGRLSAAADALGHLGANRQNASTQRHAKIEDPNGCRASGDCRTAWVSCWDLHHALK